MPNTLCIAFEKVKHNSVTGFLNSVTMKENNSDPHRFNPIHFEHPSNDLERVLFGVADIVIGPINIVSGAAMLVSGLILTPIPGVITHIHSEEIIADNDKHLRINSLSIECRIPRTPFHYEQTKVAPGYYYRVNGVELAGGLHCSEPDLGCRFSVNTCKAYGQMQESASTAKLAVDTTVTGFQWMTAGVQRMVIGVCSPVRGAANILTGSGHALFSSLANQRHARRSQEQSIPAGELNAVENSVVDVPPAPYPSPQY